MSATTALSLGIDLGTTSTKALLLDAEGTVVAVASAHHGIDPVSDGVQVDPAVWIASARRAVAELGASIDLGRVSAIGLSGNMSAVVLVDGALDPVVPALLLADRRGADELRALDDDITARMLRQSGNLPSAVFSLSSLLWWQSRYPETLAHARAYLSAKDYLRATLTGDIATDSTDAWNALLLRPDGQWDDDLIAAVGLPRHLFPAVLSSSSTAGTVHEGAAAAFGVPLGVPVAIGAGDVAATLEGLGGIDGDEVAVALGTSAVMMAAIDPASGSGFADGAFTQHPAVDGTRFALASLLTGGLALNWLRATVGAAAIAQAPSDPDPDDPLCFLPYLAGTGSPDFDERATGALIGLTPTTSAPRMVSAALEAIAFDLADLIDRLERDRATPYRHITACGGGTNVAAWPQIIADVTGLPVRVVAQADLAAVGAAQLGWAAVGHRVRSPRAEHAVLPRPAFADAWRRRRDRFRIVRRSLLELERQPHTPDPPSQKAAS
ncbi:hypothetical protein DEA06_16045 [Microbacterium sp. Gd 4-13]|uniref:xylulokinase n=1 Tax=Microbacterium sp. Gd 4-13 TaxID=2173179 RepID=UPI000D5873A2|nr:FGGY family carbohydrate kinase [Microbacterium sp. Gd 4-13]PVW02185.1 hypothetical protein DEA06_16045 [Microbacterium sp. Gd 4-13]